MAKSSGLNFNLPSVDDLFSTEEERAEARLEKIVNLSPAEISDFPNHPFKVRMDEAMQEMTESVKQYGVLVPTLVRPKPEGGYEMVAGHRRKKAADLAGLAEIPCIVRQLTDDEATIIMVDSNLQREQILPSEKAFAYKMKLDAMKRQQGERTDLTSATPLQKLAGKTSRQILAEQSGESHEQIRKYIRLTHLIPEILELVDNSVLKDQEMLQIALRPAVELSYLRKEEQADLFAIMDEMDCTPSHAQAIKMRQMSEAKTGDERLAKDALVSIMKEEKPNQVEQFKIPKNRIAKFFPAGTPAQKIEDTIVKALELYRKRQRRWTCSPTCKPANPRSWSMCPATSTVPRPMTACGFPTANGAGFPAGLAVTVRWTISSRSTAIPFWRPWKLSPEGLPSRRLPLCQRRRRKSPSTCFCPRPPRIIGR